ncbi:MAG: tetratricopeptide repeat protein [Blastocatellia bacterium]|nr:tetratricopeptide repeat protein [Blastocatellia bacterium]
MKKILFILILASVALPATTTDDPLYVREEFFGVQAIVPRPTAEARARLAGLARQRADDAAIIGQLAETEEQLGQHDLAEASLRHVVGIEKGSLASLGRLAEFYGRRARFADEAAVRERMLAVAPREERAPILRLLIEMAERHQLAKYRQPAFFEGLIAADPASFEVVRQFVEHQIEMGERGAALETVRRHRGAFPGEAAWFLEQEVALLGGLGRSAEAEKIYRAAFDPFWPKARADEFYSFLTENDRLRAYGRELRDAVRRNPANFDAAVRLYHYLQNDYVYAGGSATAIFARLERARAQRGVKWTSAELAAVAELLIASGELEPASRFLYTLHNQGGFAPGSVERGRVLYALFELLIRAGEQRTPLTAGDLRFYADVAKADPHPGMLGGILSLALADSNPRGEFANEEAIAVSHFNRAAAWRLFTVYRQEQPTSPQMAGMYLDLIRLYSTSNEPGVAAELLAEFGRRYADAPEFAEVATALADCYLHLGKHEQERAIRQQIMDTAGRRRRPGVRLVPVTNGGGAEPTAVSPTIIAPSQGQSEGEGEEPAPAPGRRLLASPRQGPPPEIDPDYLPALNRLVASLARERRTADILALYSREIAKYPDEQGLYEQRLQWLGQTSLVDEQLRAYQEAIRRFPSNLWTDRLARWYLRQGRRQEFEKYAHEVIERLDDAQAGEFIRNFAEAGAGATATAFEAGLYESLHRAALRRFPHNLRFAEGLLRFYANRRQWEPWRALAAEYYFESKPIREQYLEQLAAGGRLREQAAIARGRDSAIYRLFRADAAIRLANYEEAVADYRELCRLYPNRPDFAERLVALTRSFGQKEAASLAEAASVQQALADQHPSSEAYRTVAGELQAERGDYRQARAQWERLLQLGVGEKEVYLNAATVYWDYFQYDDALRVLRALRRQKRDESLHAFQMGALLEAKRETGAAIAEYVKELDESAENHGRAKRRLATLRGRRGVPAMIDAAVRRELARARDREALTLGYIAFLDETGRWPEAAALLRSEAARSRSQSFLDAARDWFQEREDEAGERLVLRRLVEAARTERFAISYRLQLAELAAKQGRRDEAAAILAQLVARHPTNYGVLSEAADFQWRLGRRDAAVALLTRSAQRSRGRFHYLFARKLAARQIERGQWPAAERVLTALYRENPRNLDVFGELSRVYVRTSQPAALRERYRETIRAIRDRNLDRAAIEDQVGQLREKVIESFTQLKEYGAAIEQHIEIINRDPDDEENLDAALRYAKRYGGGETLLAYYARTSAEAWKDYRWNLVLARIHEARRDWAAAAREARKAIDNQPEMVELHSMLAGIHLQAKEYDAAAKALRRALELTNDDPAFLKQLAEVYEKAGRRREADAVRAKLPVEQPRAKSLGELFAEADGARRTERARAIGVYRKAFEQFAGDVYKHELRDYELNGYVETLRGEEPLDRIFARLWEVRERVRRDAESRDNLLAGRARTLLDTFDRAMPEAIGRVAAEYATGDERAAIERDARARLREAKGPSGEAALAALFNLSRRARLGALSEEILAARLDAAAGLADPAIARSRAMTLVNFHSERGDYARAIEALRREAARDQAKDRANHRPMIAEYARLINDREAELTALREEYAARSGATAVSDPLIERYFELLLDGGDAGRAELRQRIAENHPSRFQLIAFLVRRNEIASAREALDRAPMSAAWKASRQAELSLFLKDGGPESGAWFVRALQPRTIGELVASQPGPDAALEGDAWFAMAESYGRWLASVAKNAPDARAMSARFLPAMIENRPKDPGAQAQLARWHAARGEHERALEHLSIALEMRPEDKAVIADLGAARFNLGQRAQAFSQWARIIEGDKPSVEDGALYLRVLSRHGLAAEARATLRPMVVRRIEEEDLDAARPLIHALARSFGAPTEAGEAPLTEKEEAARTAFLRELCEAVPGNAALPEMMLREQLVKREAWAPFYEMLIARTEGVSRYSSDYDFVEQLRERSGWSAEEIEESIDHRRAAAAQSGAQSATQSGEPESARLPWQREYLDYLFAKRADAEAAALVASIERELKGRYPRPDWLRLAAFRCDLRAGRVSQAMAGLRRFARIAPGSKIEFVVAPGPERLSAAATMLRAERRPAEAEELQRAAHERTLAMEQLQAGPFISLARLAFEKGDADRGLTLLRTLIALGVPETRETAAAELAARDWVTARAVNGEWIETPAPANAIQEPEALRLAAELAAEFRRFAPAIEWRERLRAISPGDLSNGIELARLRAASGANEQALAAMAGPIADGLIDRRSRWTALWVAAEIAGANDALWRSLDERVKSATRDSEMLAAIAALHRGQVAPDAAAAIPSPELRFVAAVLQAKSGHRPDALRTLLDSRIDLGDAALIQPFAATEDEPRWLLVRLYAASAAPRAALKLAAVDDRLKGVADEPAADFGEPPPRSPRFQTLSVRAGERQLASYLELLALLSLAAEQIEDLDRAIDFERARLAVRRDSRARLDALLAKRRELRRRSGFRVYAIS